VRRKITACAARGGLHRCDPWAFSHPTLQDGTPSPAAGPGGSVQLGDVAWPVQDAMFRAVPADSQGLLLALTFDDPAVAAAGGPAQQLGSGSAWAGPPLCSAGLGKYGDVCPGCLPFCAFGNCLAYNGSCLSRARSTAATAAMAAAAQATLARGTCACRDIAGCPAGVESCSCPRGLARVCSTCGGRGVCAGGPAEDLLCLSDADCGAAGRCVALDPRFCPAGLCERWACECFPLARGSTTTGFAGQQASSDRVSGTGSCICKSGMMLEMPLRPGSIPGLNIALPPYICCLTSSPAPVLAGATCWRWNDTDAAAAPRCISPPRAGSRSNGLADCLLGRCCAASQASSRRATDNPDVFAAVGPVSPAASGHSSNIPAAASGSCRRGQEGQQSSDGSAGRALRKLLRHKSRLLGKGARSLEPASPALQMNPALSMQMGGQNRRSVLSSRRLAATCSGPAYVVAQLGAVGATCLSAAAEVQLQDVILAAAATTGLNSTARRSVVLQAVMCASDGSGEHKHITIF
jgi:hypothetical protein